MTDLSYERLHPNAYEWTDKAYDLLVDGKLDGHVDRRDGLEVATVTGECPRCHHQFRFGSSQDAISSGGRTLESDEEAIDTEEYVPVDVRCTCTDDHAGRRDGEAGCGIVFRIEVKPENHDD